jgi:hypothetical protein
MYTCIRLVKAPHRALEVCFVVSKVVPNTMQVEITYSGKTGLHYFAIGDTSQVARQEPTGLPLPIINTRDSGTGSMWMAHFS